MERVLRMMAQAALAMSLLAGCVAKPEERANASPVVEEIILSAPTLKGETSLEETLASRHSVRSFTAEALTLAEIGQLLWAAQGITRDWGGRTAPSAGALYPLEVYVATADGLYHYVPQGHKVRVESTADLRQALWRAGLKQSGQAGGRPRRAEPAPASGSPGVGRSAHRCILRRPGTVRPVPAHRSRAAVSDPGGASAGVEK